MTFPFPSFAGGLGVDANDYFADTGSNFPFSGVTFPHAIYVSATDTTWIVWEAWNGSQRRVYITSRNHTTGRWGAIKDIGHAILTDDAHGVPAIVRDNDGYLHVFFGGHDSNMAYRSSSAPDDASNWSEQFSLVGDYTYPHPVNVGGTIYLFMREGIVGSIRRLVLFKTTSVVNGVLTFGSLQSIVSYGTDSRVYATQFLVSGTDIHFAASFADFADTFRRDVYYYVYETVSGDVHNIEDDVTIAAADLPVDLTESNADFIVVDQTTNETNVPAICFDTSGNTHLAYIDGSSSPWTVKHKVFSGGSWSATTDVGEVTNGFDNVSVVPLPAGAVEVWWPEDDAAAWARGGNMARRERSSGGSWGSEQIVLTATTKALNQPQTVRDGDAELRVIFCETTQTELDADAGGLKLYAYGSGGFMERPNVAATDITCSVVGISELWSTGVPFAFLNAVDTDFGDTFTFTEVADPDGKFSISGNALHLSATLDYGVATSHSVTVRATDSFGLTFDKAFTIDVIAEDTETMPVISTHSPSAVATLDISLPFGYRAFKIIGWLQPATDNVGLWLRTSTDAGVSFDAGASDYDWAVFQDDGSASNRFVDTADSELVILGADTGVGNAAQERINFEIMLLDPDDTAKNKSLQWQGSRRTAAGALVHFIGAGARLNTADIDALRFLFASDNIADGEVTLIGIPS